MMGVVLASLLLMPWAPAETLWAAGVNEQGGWYDFNKSPDRSDSELCWAITAANLLAWWQEQRADVVCPAIPQKEKVWQVVRDSFNNEGGGPR